MNPLVVEEFAEGMENRQLQVLRMQSLFSLLLLCRLAAPLFRTIFFRFFVTYRRKKVLLVAAAALFLDDLLVNFLLLEMSW